MAEAERRQYAVGYFERWNLESLQAVADASESMRSPVLLGFSGIYLHHPRRPTERTAERLCGRLETKHAVASRARLAWSSMSPAFERVLEAIELGFGLVMFSDENLSFDEQSERVSQTVARAHRARGGRGRRTDGTPRV